MGGSREGASLRFSDEVTHSKLMNSHTQTGRNAGNIMTNKKHNALHMYNNLNNQHANIGTSNGDKKRLSACEQFLEESTAYKKPQCNGKSTNWIPEKFINHTPKQDLSIRAIPPSSGWFPYKNDHNRAMIGSSSLGIPQKRTCLVVGFRGTTWQMFLQ